MASLRIPEKYKSGLAAISSLPDSHFGKLLRAVEDCPAFVTVADIAAHVAQSVPEIDGNEVERILSSLCSLYTVRIDIGITVHRLASDVFDAMRLTAEEGLKISTSEQQKFKDRLEKLLSADCLSYAAKAQGLRSDFACIFCDAKILTDLRPIFEKPEEHPTGAVITHTLKLVYHEGGNHKELYLALDLEDITELKKILDRAESKDKSLIPFLEEMGTRGLRIKSKEDDNGNDRESVLPR